MTIREFGSELIKLEEKYLDLFDNKDKYNINPKAGKNRLGAKHTEATKNLFSELRKTESSL